MGIAESNWLIRTLSKGMESNPYTPEERARMAREDALRADKSNPVNEYVLGRIHMVRNHWFHLKERFGWVPPTNKEFGDKLANAQKALDRAYYSRYIGAISQETQDKIQSVRGPLATIVMHYRSAAGSVEDVDRAMNVMSSCEALSSYAHMDINDPNYAQATAAAAHEFDNLFGFLGGFVDKVPVLKQYAPIFSEISRQNFFSDMQRIGQSRADIPEAQYRMAAPELQQPRP